MSRKTRFRFFMKDDIDLLKEVLSVNPFSGDSVNKWAEIAENFMMVHQEKALDGRRCQERTSLLLAFSKEKNRDKLLRHGTDEENVEKEQLLQEVLALSEQAKFKTEKGKDESQKTQLIRKRAIKNMKTDTSDENDDSQCSVKRRKSNT
ncbi:uncharacterized protein LOC134262119 [Saccostrea cucullata]|uniref:uncharacterized protein LOC134262119 n=1 Tax=Saccostrea cuccullata TaxID=36930 RepID=UPI002ED67D9E